MNGSETNYLIRYRKEAPMNMSTDVNWLENVRSLTLDRQEEPQWLRNWRLSFLDNLSDYAWPKRQKTPLRERQLDQIPLTEEFRDTSVPLADLHSIESPLHVVFANDRVVEQGVSPEAQERGLVILSFRQAATQYELDLKEWLGQIVSAPLNKAEALNAGLWDHGLFIKVPDGVDIQDPLLVLHYGHFDNEVTSLFPRTLIIAGINSRITVIERYISNDFEGKSLFSNVVEIMAKEGAQVHYGSVQNLSNHTEVFVTRSAVVNKDAHVDWNIGEFGGNVTIARDHTRLAEAGAQSAHTMVFFGSGHQRQDFDTEIIHGAPYSTSRITAKGVMKDKGRSAFHGITNIEHGAVRSDGRQKEQTLMLSDQSRADAVPSLLINDNDVYAAHSASAGPIDQLALFYLMARGLSEEEATRLYVHGFLAPVVDAIPGLILRNSVWESVERKLRA
ncbi:MAG TPA: Fe-S cluster assembly protein SufD [Sulfobacillus sp.]|nr:Fe-S cluster assembly protein SufD [Sulfobacillus sp.]